MNMEQVKLQVCSCKQYYATALQMTHYLLRTQVCKIQLLLQLKHYQNKSKLGFCIFPHSYFSVAVYQIQVCSHSASAGGC